MCQQLYHRYLDCGHIDRAKLQRCPEAEAGIPRRKRSRCYESREFTRGNKWVIPRVIPESHIDEKAGMCGDCAVALYEESNALLKKWADEELATEMKELV